MSYQANKNYERSEEKRGIEKPTKISGPSIQGIVKTKMEVVEA